MKCSFNFKKDYTILDLEATGLSTRTNEIIEVAALKIRDNKIVDTYQSYVKPNQKIPPEIVELTGIDDKTVEHARRIQVVLDEVLDFIGNDPLMGHNICFDICFLNSIDPTKQIKNEEFYDTCMLAQVVLKDQKHYRLIDLAHQFDIDSSNAHSALKDCYMTYGVYMSLIDYLKKQNVLL